MLNVLPNAMGEDIATIKKTLRIFNVIFLPNEFDQTPIATKNIIRISLNRILNQIIPAFLQFNRSKIFYNLSLRKSTKNLTNIRQVRFDIVRGILKLVDIIQVNKVHHHIVKIFDNFDIIFRKTEEVRNNRQTTRSCTTYPMDMGLFQFTIFVNVLVMQDISPISEFRTNGRKECFTII